MYEEHVCDELGVSSSPVSYVTDRQTDRQTLCSAQGMRWVFDRNGEGLFDRE